MQGQQRELSVGGIAVFAALGVGAWLVIRQLPEEPAPDQAETVTEVAVRVTPLVTTTLHERISAYGMVKPEPATEEKPAAIAKLALSTSGLITEVSCSEGQQVKKGDVLVSLDARVDQSRLDQARSALEFATQENERQKTLLTIDGASLKSVQSAENDLHKAKLEVAAAETALALLRLEAPITGIVAKVNVRQGEAADPSSIAVEILDPTRLVLSVQLPSPAASTLKPGQAAAFFREGQALPSEGSVVFISPLVDSTTGAVEVLVAIPQDASIRPGEWLEVSIVAREKPGVLAAPIESVTADVEGVQAIAVVQGDTATRVPVITGVRDGGLIEVAGEGLTEGAQVVTEGAYGLPEETKVRILPPN